MLMLPATIRTVPRNLASRCVGRRVVGYPHSDLWPDEVVVTKDTVFGYSDTLASADLEPERDDRLVESVLHLIRLMAAQNWWGPVSPTRPDGRAFYTLTPETTAERPTRDARIKAETKHFIAAIRAGQKRDAALAAGVIDLF